MAVLHQRTKVASAALGVPTAAIAAGAGGAHGHGRCGGQDAGRGVNLFVGFPFLPDLRIV
jgi:hypothetical protein